MSIYLVHTINFLKHQYIHKENLHKFYIYFHCKHLKLIGFIYYSFRLFKIHLIQNLFEDFAKLILIFRENYQHFIINQPILQGIENIFIDHFQ